MGKVGNSIISGTSGRTGRIVVANVNGVEISRIRPQKSNKPPTPTQQAQRDRFKFCVSFLSGYRQFAKKYFGTPSGLVTRYNQAFSNVMDAVSLNEKNQLEVDCEKIMFCKGNLLDIEPISFSSPDALAVEVEWNNNSEGDADRENDELVLVYYSDFEESTHLKVTSAKRSDKTYSFNVLPKYQNKEVHIWCAMKAADETMSSKSVYLGSLTIS